MAVGATAATITAGKLAWSAVKALAAAGAIEAAINCLEEYYDDIKKLGYSEEYLNEAIKNPESIADIAWEEYEQETLYPNDEDITASKYQENYDETLAAEKKLTAKAGDFDFSEKETIGEKLPGKENEEQDKGPGIGLPGTPTETPTEGIEDKTDENLGTNNISAMDWIAWAEQEQAKQWAREDEIRQHVEEREDSAWQRGVEDMRKAGINVNLVGASPAASGGGINQATGQNLTGATTQMNIDLDKLQQMIDNAFKGDENDKDRFIDLLGTTISMIGLIAALKK